MGGLVGVANLRLLPDTFDVALLASFTLTVQVEPDGQPVSEVRAVLEFDPSHIQVVAAQLDSNSLLHTQMEASFDNTNGTVTLAARAPLSPPSTTFTMGSVTFEVLPVHVDPEVRFGSQTYARLEDDDVTGELFSSTIRIPVFGPSQ